MPKKEPKMTTSIIICAVYLLLAVAGMTFIKSGHSTESLFSIPGLGLSLSVRTLIGILFYGCSFLVFTFYVSKLNIGIAIPIISGLNSLAMVAIGYCIFKEHISAGQFAGIGLIVLGTVIVGIFK